jgi:predicted amidohydrolase YtcJ
MLGSDQTKADTVLLNANVITMASFNPRAQGVAIRGSKILAVGSKEEISRSINERTRIVDINGKTVLPGFIDAHAHLTYTGMFLSSLDLFAVQSVKELLERVQEYAESVPDGKLLLGFGLDDAKYPEKRYPTRFELDKVAPSHFALIVHVTAHSSTINTKSFEYLGLSGDEPGVDKDPKTGTPNGVLRDPIIETAHPKLMGLMTDNDLKQAIRMAAVDATKVGLTTIHTVGEPLGPRNERILEELTEQLPVRVVLYPFMSGDVDSDIESTPTKTGLKMLADGAIETHTAALFEPYTDDPLTKGMLYYTHESMSALVLKVHNAGLQLAIHCESDTAIDQVLDAYEAALREHPREDHRLRIEHYELSTDEQNRRVARLGVYLSMQPAFIYLWGGRDGKYREYLGDERMKRAHSYKDLLKLGIVIAGGSDSPVTRWNPIFGIHSLVNHPNVEQRVSVEDALRLFTLNGARIAFEEHKKGSIEVGKFADLVVLSDNPFAINQEEIKDLEVLMTIVAGNTVYEKNSSITERSGD